MFKFINRILNLFFSQEMLSIRQRFIKGAFWSFIGMAISQGLTLISSMIIARFLGNEGFGQLGIIRNTTGMFGVFAGFGLGLTATKYISEYQETNKKKTGQIIALTFIIAIISGGILTILQFSISDFLAKKILNAPTIVFELQLSSLIIFFSTMNGTQTGALAGFEAFKKIALVNLFKGLSSFPLLLIGVWLFNLKGVVIALILIEIIGWSLNRYILNEICRNSSIIINYSEYSLVISKLWEFSIPALLANIIVIPITWISFIFLVNQPNGYSEMGLFSAANQWRTALLFIPGVMGQAIIPIMSDNYGKKNYQIIKKVLWNAIVINAIIVIPLGVGIILLSSLIMNLYGEGFQIGWFVLILCSITGCILSIQTPVGNVIAATGKMWYGFLMNFGWAIVLLISSWYLVVYGAVGLALAYLIAYIIHTIWTLGYGFYVLKK